MAENKQMALIEAYLQDFAAKDPAFAEKLKDTKHTIDGCYNFIRQQARKEAVGGCAMIEDKVVFGWAVHYYDEPIQEPKKAPKADAAPKAPKKPTVVVKIEAKPEPKQEKPIKSAAVAAVKAKESKESKTPKYLQMSLFD